jgi:hypothetical protein
MTPAAFFGEAPILTISVGAEYSPSIDNKCKVLKGPRPAVHHARPKEQTMDRTFE